MCRYNRVVVSWRPINKAPCEHVHGLMFDVRSLILILNFTEEGFDKEPDLLPVVCGDFINGTLWIGFFRSNLSSNLLLFPMGCLGILTKTTRF